ncbi:outer membrane protein assembly factor BamA [Sphingomonas ginkgonis]|uniref:Outer membrane protein assembly factor BamA n=1 Tax=Sphingomonas ginkgonis TaxID=2315330 RepID=A0A3R9WSG2_9SPHN|nr:outer membrane protein assembly factor BamA [Sphingomonas ginkgonis]RST32213.1 outer membrane protein assembly factor BamA [Sphingomonas ginkgonis]
MTYRQRAGAALLISTALTSWSAPLLAQAAPAPAQTTPQQAPAAEPQAPAAAPAPVVAAPTQGTIRSVRVVGTERLEAETVRQYANLSPGQTYTAETLDQAIKDLYATELFADAQIGGGNTGDIVITVRENPVINRIVLEGNKRLKSDKINPEIKLAPRQIFTRSKVRADVDRIIELYKRQGRFAATVEPKVVQLDQNRVDLIFEINEGDLSKVRAINIIGNKSFGHDRLVKEMYTKQAGGFLGFLKSNDTYDPDRLAADQQKLRAFYLTQGYADFRVVQALAELTPDRRDFIITYVVEEGPRYKFGKIDADSQLRDFANAEVLKTANIKTGTWFNAKQIEDSVTALNEKAGGLGYAFADIDPDYNRNVETKTMDVTFKVNETPRVYVERIEITGNTNTRDKVIRREFRINEGDAFNAQRIKRTQDRIQSLGYFQDKLEVKQAQGSAADRVVLSTDVQEKSTGQLQVSAGYSSLEKFIVALSVEQNNFRGMGQSLSAGVNYSRYSKSVQLGFTEPYLFDKQVLLGGEIYRRDLNSFNYIGNERNTTYSQTTTGGGLRLGFPVNEYLTIGTRYSLNFDKISLDQSTFYTNGVCDPLKAGTYLCDELGKRTTSSIGYSFAYDNTNGIRATRGQRAVFSQDFAGLGGDVRYLRTQANGTKYWGLPRGFILSAHAEGGYIKALKSSSDPTKDPIRLNDRFFGQDLRGFDIRGIGPRVIRTPYDITTGNLVAVDKNNRITDALGGRAYYMGRLELEIPLSSAARNLGLRPSAFVDVGSVFGLRTPALQNFLARCIDSTTGNTVSTIAPGSTVPVTCPTGQTAVAGYQEVFSGNSPKPRVSVGIGVNWTSPFGPLRIDLAKALVKQPGDETKLFSFNVGTSF